MSTIKQVIGITFIVISILGCNQESYMEKKQKKIIKSWTGQNINIPTELQILKKENSVENERFMVVHVMDIACSSCVDEIKNLKPYISKLTKQKNISVLLIIKDTTNQDIESAKSIDCPCTIAIDSLNLFITRNRIINTDILRTFLLDKNKIVCIGNITSKDFQKQILEYLQVNNI